MKFVKKNKKLIVATPATALILAGVAYFWGGAPPTIGVPGSTDTNRQEQENYHPEVSLQAFSQKEFDGRDLTQGQVLSSNEAYTQYYITYKSGDLTISGIMMVPHGDGPFPVLVLNHGYIDPAVYTVGRGLRREQDYFARNGYVVIHPDYRNHGDSDNVGNTERQFRLGYTEDVINAVYAVRESDLGFLDKQNIGTMGHSMGGGVALQILATHPNLVKAISLYAPVSADARDNFDKWTRSRTETANAILQEHGTQEENPEFWDNLSPINFIDKMQTPVILHHGTADDSVPIEWSERFVDAMEDKSKDIIFHVYQNGAHEFGPHWPTFMQRNVDFFDTHLKNTQPQTTQTNGPFVTIGQTEVAVELADTPAKRAQGLSGRQQLGENSGMLFVFPIPREPNFWMKDMNLALDFIWIDENMEIVHISENVLPESYPQRYSPPQPVKYVLEVNSGFVDKNNITIGEMVELQNL